MEQTNGHPLALLMHGKRTLCADPVGLFERVVNEANDAQPFSRTYRCCTCPVASGTDRTSK